MPWKKAAALWMVAGCTAVWPVLAGERIFSSSFEDGDVSAWGATLPPAFRFADLDLRDPHIFADLPVFGCTDVTDTAPIGQQSFNEGLAEAITTDGDEDGFLDASFLLLFEPLDVLGVGLDLTQSAGDCLAPLETTCCNPAVEATPIAGTYDGQAAGACLGVEPGTTSGYVPAVAVPEGPCFVSMAQQVTFDLGGIEVPLQNAQIAAEWVGDPPMQLQTGLLRGFLLESDADAIMVPGGLALSELLPGGTGNCSAGDDTDVVGPDTGWWFYLQFSAEQVPFSFG